MSAIYQRARPIRWEDVVGQEHVKDVLRTALEQGRIGHAYLFSGPRGVGKTTTARLIAMTANCTGPAPKPCGECESCLAVRAGSHPDVMEIDAASNNSVDDVRDLREKVGLAAMRGGKKIYILDEAHMMSRAAFNALLKTLEEPPEHVIFILATTEPEKIIPTILSRCQHYRFRRHTPEEIAGKLAGLAAQEGATADPDALQLIGRLADGAMRDGESLLERMLAAGTAVTRPAVEEALGLPPGERVRSVASALLVGDAGEALSGAAQLYRDGFAARTVVEGLVSAFGAALHAELGLGEEGRLESAEVPRLLKLQAALDEQEARFARSADQQSLELALTHALLAADAGASGSAAVLNSGAASAPAQVPGDLLQRLNRLEKELSTLRSAPRTAAPAPAAAAADPAGERGPVPVREAVREAAASISPAAAPAQGSWEDFLKQVVAIGGQQIRAFIKEGRPDFRADGLYVVFDKFDKQGKPSNRFHAQGVIRNKEVVIKAIRSVFGDVALFVDSHGEVTKLISGSSNASGQAVDPQAIDQNKRLQEVADSRMSTPSAAPSEVELPDFGPAPRRGRRGPEFEPVAVAAPPAQPQPVAVAQSAGTPTAGTQTAGTQTASAQSAGAQSVSAPTASAPPPSLPARPPARPGSTRPAPAARAPETRLPDPPSPDDVAPAPLPDEPFGAWEDEHVAEPPPAPADAQGGDRVTPPGQSRELYLGEVITEEPDWDSFGAPVLDDVEAGGAALLEDAPFAEYSAPRPAPRPAPAPREAAGPPPAGPPPAAPTRPGDIRAHPMFEDIKGRFSGRVREIGKNRRVQPESSETDSDEGEDGAKV